MTLKISDYLTTKYAAEYLGISQSALKQWEKSGKLKPYRNPHNNWRLYKKEDLQKILDSMSNK